MSSCEQKRFVPCGCTHQMVSKTPTITFRLDTTPEFCARPTRYFCAMHAEATVRASLSSLRANRTKRSTSACAPRRVRADPSQNHPLASKDKRAVATRVQATMQGRHSEILCDPKKVAPSALPLKRAQTRMLPTSRFQCRLSTLRTYGARAKAVSSGCVPWRGVNTAPSTGQSSVARARLQTHLMADRRKNSKIVFNSDILSTSVGSQFPLHWTVGLVSWQRQTPHQSWTGGRRGSRNKIRAAWLPGPLSAAARRSTHMAARLAGKGCREKPWLQASPDEPRDQRQSAQKTAGL